MTLRYRYGVDHLSKGAVGIVDDDSDTNTPRRDVDVDGQPCLLARDSSIYIFLLVPGFCVVEKLGL